MSSTEILAKNIRISALRMVYKAKASHIASALSIADILAVLYGCILHFDKDHPSYPERDRFILSKGHACVAVYAALAEVGIITKVELESYGEDFSWLMNHISHKVPGVEFSTGSLGHGLPFGVGKALSARVKKNATWNTYVLLSDGEMDEGSNWEALMFAAHHKLSNLVAIIDHNKLQSLDTTDNTLSLEPLRSKLESFGCFVLEVDGHSHSEMKNAFLSLSLTQPTVIIAHTTKGRGVSFMENKIEWHYKNPTENQLQCAINELEHGNA